ncbi:MAG: shikimate dehydrogenase [Sphaerochaetaceae bacterium]|nr:shikimate dehydrogenase [Sphaerochaetaceae bacterium]
MGKCYRAELTGVFGCPVDDNPTVVLEEAGFKALGLNYRYLTIKVEDGDLEVAMQAVRTFNMRGINLTMPHKVKVLQYLDELSPAAQIIGAVNTVVNNNGRLWGENTDGKGFVASLHDAEVALSGKRVTILGAGGAARAIAVECALGGAADVIIINRNVERGEELARLIATKTPASARYIPWRGAATIPRETDILVQATNVGLIPDTGKPDIDYGSLHDGMVACDVVFNPPLTGFLVEAAHRGLRTVNGLGMLVNQGALNFTLWTGEPAPYKIMYDALQAEFGA